MNSDDESIDATIKRLAIDGGLGTGGVLMVGLWAMPGWARKTREEKPKSTDGKILGLLVAIDLSASDRLPPVVNG